MGHTVTYYSFHNKNFFSVDGKVARVEGRNRRDMSSSEVHDVNFTKNQ